MSTDVYYRAFLNRDRMIHILESDPAIGDALAAVFRLDGFQVRTAHAVTPLLDSFEARRPDVVILNFRVHGESMLPLLERIKDLRAGIAVFMIADSHNVDLTVAAMRQGAADVFVKPVDKERCLQAVRDTLKRDVHVSAAVHGQREVEIRGFQQLTPREREVLQLITNGQSNKEAGRELGISPRTIEVHRARVMEKLGARNTADLIRIVLTS
ncbi:response regulator transcription factor [Pelagibacterium montanilacus]|uniref:response regulator transcription factor n=1 Tax=Pelagibacterium montanilacus TaxID=2185280 RepID=UPI000F8EC2AC|nr:LuxR C-terminal-related transcriptional regulator [Pelagibacterium montanilacus]